MGLIILGDCKYILVKQFSEEKKSIENLQERLKYSYEIISPTGSTIFFKTEGMIKGQRSMSYDSNFSSPYFATLFDVSITKTLTITEKIKIIPRYPKFTEDHILYPMMKRYKKEISEYIIMVNDNVIGTIFRGRKFNRSPCYYISNVNRSVTIVAIGKKNCTRKTMSSVVSNGLNWLRSHTYFTFLQVHPFRKLYYFQYLAKATKFLDTLSKSENGDSNCYLFRLRYAHNLETIMKLLLLGASLVIDFDYWRTKLRT